MDWFIATAFADEPIKITPEITFGMIINWVIVIGVGICVLGLVKYIFKREKELLLTKNDHIEICTERGNAIQKTFDIALEKQTLALTKYFDLAIENKILKTMREINGKKDA